MERKTETEDGNRGKEEITLGARRSMCNGGVGHSPDWLSNCYFTQCAHGCEAEGRLRRGQEQLKDCGLNRQRVGKAEQYRMNEWDQMSDNACEKMKDDSVDEKVEVM